MRRLEGGEAVRKEKEWVCRMVRESKRGLSVTMVRP